VAFPGEQVFEGATYPVTYLLLRPAKPSNRLAVVFSGIRPTPGYTYIRTLQTLDANLLFILDDVGPEIEGVGRPGSWYLGPDRAFKFEDDVMALIRHVCESLEVPMSGVVSGGSSKGGYASLYYAFKYGFGAVVVGGAQTRLGQYLLGGKFKPVADFIAGGRGDAERAWLNSLLFDAIANSTASPEVRAHIGLGDRHFLHHLLPLVNELADHGHSLRLECLSYTSHNNLGLYFPGFFFSELADLLDATVGRPRVDTRVGAHTIASEMDPAAQTFVVREGMRCVVPEAREVTPGPHYAGIRHEIPTFTTLCVRMSLRHREAVTGMAVDLTDVTGKRVQRWMLQRPATELPTEPMSFLFHPGLGTRLWQAEAPDDHLGEGPLRLDVVCEVSGGALVDFTVHDVQWAPVA
jgi:hypothetical protein